MDIDSMEIGLSPPLGWEKLTAFVGDERGTPATSGS